MRAVEYIAKLTPNRLWPVLRRNTNHGKAAPVPPDFGVSIARPSQLLQRAGYTFDVIPSHIDEPNDAGYPDARSLVQHVAWLKAAAVAATGVDG